LGERFEGPISATNRFNELELQPIGESVTVYHVGKSDEPAAPSRKQLVVDFPSSTPYEGPLSALTKRPEHESEPMESQVDVYHHGRSDVPLQRPPPLKEEATTEKIVSVPLVPAYEGPVSELSRFAEAGAVPLDQRVAAYHSGRSDEKVERIASAETKPDTEVTPSALERLMGLLKKSPAHDDFPSTEPYLGALSALSPRRELQGEGIDHWVAAYHPGWSDEAVPVTVVEVEQTPAIIESERKPDTLTRKGYPPIGTAYDGPISTLDRRTEVEPLVLTSLLTPYHSGRSDEPRRVIVEAEPRPETVAISPTPPHKETALKRLTSLFTKAHPHEDFPRSEPYEGHLSELASSSELPEARLDSHVDAYHATGRSDQPLTTTAKQVVEKF
jgi:hypothetical protein